jgi:phosphoribosyl-ATP pyrophosphohydrolase
VTGDALAFMRQQNEECVHYIADLIFWNRVLLQYLELT